LDTWKHVLNATGGAMRSKKCAWVLLSFMMQHRETVFESSQKHPTTLNVLDADDICRPIERYEYSEAREYLGVRQTANDNDDEQYEVLMKNVNTWNEMITKSKLPPILNLNALLNRIHKKIEYPLPATTLTQERLQELSDVLYKDSLPKCGIIRKFPIRFRSLPPQYYGLGLPDMYLEMQINKIRELLQNVGKPTIMGEQLQYGLELAQLESGQDDFILNASYSDYSTTVTDSWIKHVWKFTSDMKLKFEGWKNIMKLQRTGDAFIMDSFIKAGLSKSELQTMNQCRKYLQVITISDITNGSGKKLAECYLIGYRDTSRRSKFNWQKIKKPTLNSWYSWKNNLQKILCTTDNGRYLTNPLKEWICESSQNWTWYKHSHLNILYHCTDNIIRAYTPSSQLRSSKRQGIYKYDIREILHANDLPTTILKATVSNSSRSYSTVSYEGSAKSSISVENNNTKLPFFKKP